MLMIRLCRSWLRSALARGGALTAALAGSRALTPALARSRALTPALARSGAVALGVALAWSNPAVAQTTTRAMPPIPDGVAIVRALGSHALDAFGSRRLGAMGALVRVPPGADERSLGLIPFRPGIARLYGSPEAIVAFGDAHPDLSVEVAPPLHLLLDTASKYVGATTATAEGLDGTGALVGIADTGLDVSHPDFLDEHGKTRVAWLLDLSAPPLGLHPDLEKQFGSLDVFGNVMAGAVWSSDDINAALAAGSATLPQDEVGHGTLVGSCAAGNGSAGTTPYRGVAPKAMIVAARVSAAGSESIGNDDLLRGVSFLYERADAMGLPIVANLSIGSDFGPHDGTLAWEEALASFVGPTHPGHALVVAAGNSGSIVETPVHDNVHVNPGTTIRVPIATDGTPPGPQNGTVQVWVAMHPGADLRVGLDGPGGTWIDLVDPGHSAGKTTATYNAGVFNGSQPQNSPVPSTSHGAVIDWTGAWPWGTYTITLSGSGTADLYVQAADDAAITGVSAVWFPNAVREGTINLPATHPSIIGVGCTINKTTWTSIDGITHTVRLPLLDSVGGSEAANDLGREAYDGEPCWFSSAGPTLTGLQKPEIMAPGAALVGALSQQAVPPNAMASIFDDNCMLEVPDPLCDQIDKLHGVSEGTSFSSPIVAGAIAVLFQHDPTLTQAQVLAALQGGAHRVRGPTPFHDQAGVGEVDVVGAVAAVDAARTGQTALPTFAQSWMALGVDQIFADGSTPIQGILELRAASDGTNPPAPAAGFDSARLAAYARIDGNPAPGAVQSLVERGPGVWVATFAIPAGYGGSSLTLGATFDGADIVAPQSIPIATDIWNGEYPPAVKGGCSTTGRRGSTLPEGLVSCGVAVGALARRRRGRHRRIRRRGRWGQD